MKRNATFGMPPGFFLKRRRIAGFPSASLPLFSSPPTRVLILKLLKLFPFLLIDSYIFTWLPNPSLLNDWTAITVSVHGDIFGALLFLPSRLF